MANEFRREVTGKRWETVTREKELKRKEQSFKFSARTTVVIERATVTTLHMVLACGHTRPQYPGMRDITTAKHLDCFECQRAATTGGTT